MGIKMVLTILESITYILFSYFVFHSKISIKKIKLVYALILNLLFIVISINFYDFIPIWKLCVSIGLYFCFVKETFIYKLTTFFIIWICVGFVDILLYTLLNVIFNLPRYPFCSVFSIFFINTIGFLFSSVTKDVINQERTVVIPKAIILNILLLCLISSMTLSFLVLIDIELDTMNKLTVISITLLVLGLSAATFSHFIKVKINNNENIERNILLQQNLQMQEIYFLTLYQQYDQIKLINHDISAHVFCMKSLLDAQDFTGLKNYFSELISNTGIEKTIEYCPDSFINSILYNFSPIIQENQIEFEFIYLLPSNMTLSPTEKSSLFYNIMKNSIESCVKVKAKRKIKIVVEAKSTAVVITVQNTVRDSSSLENFLKRKSSKTDPIFHGIGLKNIYTIVETYNGIMDACILDSNFQIMILLYKCL